MRSQEILKAIKDRNIDLLDKLLSKTDINFYDPEDNENTPLHEAVKVGSAEIVKKLIAKHCKINALNKFNDTPLHLAVMQPNVNVVKLLIENGADLNIKNNRNKSAIDLAMETNHSEITDLLLKYKCKGK